MAIHIAITRRVRSGAEAEFQQALREFLQASLASTGVRGVHVLEPAPGSVSREYGILRSFADEAECDAFYRSPLFEAWQQRVAPLTEGAASRRKLTGLEAWFRSGNLPPPRWKMALATLAGVYPTSVALSLTVGEATRAWSLLTRSFAFAVCMVAALTWVVMPIVTRALHGWLHHSARKESS
ncbi:MAG TPA: antibiotic biosynthesis monooxygenase [Myxococcota bacterium]|nr:antibiotic biosynthesis monooxygenase [Myxococcota bacterium]